MRGWGSGSGAESTCLACWTQLCQARANFSTSRGGWQTGAGTGVSGRDRCKVGGGILGRWGWGAAGLRDGACDQGCPGGCLSLGSFTSLLWASAAWFVRWKR